MALLDPPQCPLCFSAVPLEQLWSVSPTNRSGLLIGRIGIICPACDAKLRVVQTRVVLGMLSTYAVLMGGAFLLQTIDSLKQLYVFYVLGVVVPVVLIQQRTFPRLARLRVLKTGETVEFPLTKLSQFADLDLDDEEAASSETASDEPAWKCKSCGEENPGSFDICWKCRSTRNNST